MEILLIIFICALIAGGCRPDFPTHKKFESQIFANYNESDEVVGYIARYRYGYWPWTYIAGNFRTNWNVFRFMAKVYAADKLGMLKNDLAYLKSKVTNQVSYRLILKQEEPQDD